jgi:uncharacterized membrane protein
MAALAYLLLPVTGLVAYSLGSESRMRFHGLQAIVLGFVWPVALYGASALSPAVTRIVFAFGALVWLGLLVATAMGRDPRLPGIGSFLEGAAAESPRTGS